MRTRFCIAIRFLARALCSGLQKYFLWLTLVDLSSSSRFAACSSEWWIVYETKNVLIVVDHTQGGRIRAAQGKSAGSRSSLKKTFTEWQYGGWGSDRAGPKMKTRRDRLLPPPYSGGANNLESWNVTLFVTWTVGYYINLSRLSSCVKKKKLSSFFSSTHVSK